MSSNPTPDPLDEHFNSVMRMLNGVVDGVALDPMVEHIVSKVHEAIAEAEAAELAECEEEFLADPMNFGRAE